MPYSVMLVEDEPLIAMLYEDILMISGFEILEVRVCNADALRALERLSPEIVIVDYNLTDGPFLPVVKKLKARGTPVIVSTGYGDLTDPELADSLIRSLSTIADGLAACSVLCTQKATEGTDK